MFEKPLLITVCVIMLFAFAGIMLARRSRAQSVKPKTQTASVPDHVVYRHLFHHVLALKKKAEETERAGKDATQFRTHFHRLASLTDQEVRTIESFASEYDLQEKILDARAKPLIEAYRAQFPGGQVPHGQTPTPPPAELRSLSQQRDALTLQTKERLRTAFGPAFERLDYFVKTRVVDDVYVPSR